jgi:hypothetical protein
MRFTLGLLFGYCIRGKKRLLIATLTAIAAVCFIVLPAIALSQLALSVRCERLSRPNNGPDCRWLALQNSAYQLREANLNMRILDTRRALPPAQVLS